MEFYINTTTLYNALIKKDNKSEEVQITQADIVRHYLAGYQVLEDISKSRVRLFVETNNAEDAIAKILKKFPFIETHIFHAPTYSRVVTDLELDNLADLNVIQRDLGFKESPSYILLPGISNLRFIDGRIDPPFMMQIV